MLTVSLSGLLLSAQAQPTVTSTSPARNANAAPRPANVALTYSQAISSATAGTVRVFSQQAGGRKVLTSASASGNVVTLDPAQDFKPGETIFVTAPAAVLSTGGVAARPYVYQFTAQAGVAPGTFSGGSDPAVTNTPYSVAAADVDGDGDLDLLTAKSGSSTVSVRLNNGLGTYSGGSEVSVGDLARDVIAADVDGDGDLDLLTANYRNSGSNTVSVRLNNGLGTFGGGSEVTVGLGPTKLTVGDVDGDGDLDLLTANATNVTTNGVSNGLVSVRLNNGSGTFSGGQEVSVGGANSFPADVTVGDVDGDGDLDILAGVFISGANSTVSVRLNDGAGTFTAPATGAQVSVTNLFSVVAADVDGDGDLDLLTATGLTVSVRLNNGAGVFTPPATGAEVSVGNGLNNVAYDLTTADVDGDGDLDLLTANATGNGAPNSLVSVRLNNGSGTFAGGQEVAVGLDANSITAGDADGDGDVDLFVTNRTSNTVSVRLNQSAAPAPTITSFTPTNGAPGTTSVVITGTNFTGATGVTFNGVAAPGFLVNSATQITVSVPAGATTGPIAVTTPGGTATSTTSFTVGVPPAVTSTSPARNANAAPRPSNVVLTYNQAISAATAGTVRVFSQQAGGRKALTSAAASGNTVTLDPAQDFKPGETVFVTAPAAVLSTGGAAAVPYVYQFTARAGVAPGTFVAGASVSVNQPADRPSAPVAADLDGDGDLDFTMSVYDANFGNRLNVRLNNGTGTFTDGGYVAVSSLFRAVVTADIDGDGDLDILTANNNINTVSVRFNNGTGTFSGTAEVPVGLDPNSIVAADVDGDGDLDFLTGNTSSNTVSVRFNNGTGTFSGTTEVPMGTSNYANGLAVADLDSDGDLDILSTDASNNTISVRFNNGTGAFSGTTEVPVGSSPVGVVTADVDGDGDLDILAANQNSNTVSVRLNSGAGIFSGTTNVSVGTLPIGVTTADVDGDGDLDLLTANFLSSTVSVRLNNGTGTFSNTREVAVSGSPEYVTVADLDGDGDLDFLAASLLGTNRVQAWLNQSVAAAPTVASFTPTSGAAGTGTSVVITGTNFTGATGVTFNGVAAPGFLVNSPTQITVSVPAGATTGPIAVTTPGGTGTSTTSFTVLAAPTVTSFTPTSGAASASVVITGTNFTGATGVTFNGIAAPGFVVNSATQITVSVPAGATTGPIAVATPGGTGTSTTSFTVTVPPVVPVVTSTSPARNANAAPRPANVALTYSQAISSATAGTVRVFSQQAGGRKALTSAAASGNTVTLDPAQDFKPGERVFVTAPATVLNTSGVAARPYVYQFTAQAGVGPGTFSGGSEVAVGALSRSVVAADVDGDGDLDLLTANIGTGTGGTVSVRLNNGLGVFSGSQEIGVGTSPRNVVAADVDGDGDLDLLAANSGNNTVSVRFNNGTGTFSGGSEVDVNFYPISVVAADVDGDGDLDLLALTDSGTVSIRLNNGLGGFSGSTEVPVGNFSNFFYSLAAGDVDGDGDLDLLAASDPGVAIGTVSVRLNDGTGSFSGTQEVAVGTVPLGVAAADVDGDGDLDLLTANQAANTVSVRLNNGLGIFGGGSEVVVGTAPVKLTTADVDGDGDLDLLTANNGGNTASVRLNNGLGSFGGGSEVATGTLPNSVTAADVDGDGDLDLLTANTTANAVSVRFNQVAAVAPTVVSFTPTSGAAGLTSVVITGTNFTGATGVTFNGVAAPGFVVNSATQITVSVPAGVTTGLIAVTTPGGTGTSTTSFTVIIGWTGATSTDWFTASNWTNGVPTASQDAIINLSSFGRQPVINGGAALSKDLVLNAGATLSMSGGTLDVRGDWANNGAFTATGGTVIFGVAAPTTVPGPNLYGNSPSRFWNLNVQPNGLRISTTAGAAVQRVLTLTGNIATLGNPFTLLSSPTGGDALVVNSGGVVTGTATVQRAIDPSVNPGLGYRHYSAPVSGSTVADLATSGFTPVVNAAYNTSPTPSLVVPFPTVLGYDQSRVTLSNTTSGLEKGYFSPAALTDPLLVGRGYAVNIAAGELVDFQGTLNNGDVPLSLSRNSGAGAADGGWHLLGNPYPAPLDYSLVAPADRPNLDAAIYVFSSTGPYAGRYRTYLNGMGNPVLPLGQAFFAHVSDGQTSAGLTFRNNQRLTVPNATPFQRPAETRPLVQLALTNAAGTLADEAYVYFQAGATAGMEAGFDAVKLPNSSGLNLAALAAGQELAVNGLPLLGSASLTVPLTVFVPATGTYTLAADQLLNLAGTDVYLRDLQLNTLVDLSRQPTYTFTLNALNMAPRFELVFGPARVLGTAASLAAQVVVYPNPARTQVALELPLSLSRQAVTVALIDVLGRTVREQVLPAGLTAHTLPLAGLATGLYSLRLQTSAGVVVKKLLVD